MDVNLAFREWCAVLGLSPGASRSHSGEPGYRLGRRADGRVQIEHVLGDGAVEVVAPPMSEAEFCDAVRLVSVSFKIKTVLVARAVAKRMRKGNCTGR